MYDQLSVSEVDPDPESTGLAKAMAASHLASGDGHSSVPSPFDNSNGDQELQNSKPHIHPDLEDLTFGPLKRGPGSSTSKLPQPMKPSFQALSDDDDRDEDQHERRASLSDFSDYHSADDEIHEQHAGPSRRNYVTVSDDDGEQGVSGASSLGKNKDVEDDPFADPFADEPSRRK